LVGVKIFEKDSGIQCQKTDLNIDTVTQVASTKDTAESYNNKNGAVLRKLYDSLEDGKYQGLKVFNTSQLCMGFQTSVVHNVNPLFDII
jgi:hypothetical protein